MRSPSVGVKGACVAYVRLLETDSVIIKASNASLITARYKAASSCSGNAPLSTRYVNYPQSGTTVKKARRNNIMGRLAHCARKRSVPLKI